MAEKLDSYKLVSLTLVDSHLSTFNILHQLKASMENVKDIRFNLDSAI